MSYDSLADYYDLLVKDEQATRDWADFTERYCPGKDVLELACGSGEISIELGLRGYRVDATDLSGAMIQRAKAKPHPESVHFRVMNMLQFDTDRQVDGILCYCDSLNYLNTLDEVRQVLESAAAHLKPGGVFLFDMHTADRLTEFENEYIEEGLLEETPYQWTIQSNEDKIYQHFAFWTPQGLKQEHHIQTVFAAEAVCGLMRKAGLEPEIITDFVHPGVQPGEKLFMIGRKAA